MELESIYVFVEHGNRIGLIIQTNNGLPVILLVVVQISQLLVHI